MDKVGGEKGEGEIYEESNIEIYNTMCKTDSQWELKQGLCDRLKDGVGWGGKWKGGLRGRGHACTYG